VGSEGLELEVGFGGRVVGFWKVGLKPWRDCWSCCAMILVAGGGANEGRRGKSLWEPYR